MGNLLEKYRPRSLGDVIGNRKQIEEMLGLIRNYRKGRPIMVYGPSGSGKNIALEMISRELNFDLCELASSDFRDYNSIRNGILNSATQMSLFRKGRIILIDEIESPESGMMRAVREIVRQSRFPVVLMTSNPFTKQLYELRKMSAMIRFDKIRHDAIRGFLEDVAKKEGIKYEDKAISQLARIADGDVRSALIDMEAIGEVTESSILLLGKRRFEQSVFETTKIILKSMDSENARAAIEQSEKDPEEIFWWLEENICREYDDPEDISSAYGCLAKADYFNCLIIRRQTWSLQKYATDMISFVGASKKRAYRKFVMYQPPGFFAGLVRRNSGGMNELSEKLASGLHVSKKNAVQYMPLLRRLLKSGKLAGILTEEEKDIITRA